MQGNSREGLRPPRDQEEPTQVPKAAAILPSKTDGVQMKPASELRFPFTPIDVNQNSHGPDSHQMDSSSPFCAVRPAPGPAQLG